MDGATRSSISQRPTCFDERNAKFRRALLESDIIGRLAGPKGCDVSPEFSVAKIKCRFYENKRTFIFHYFGFAGVDCSGNFCSKRSCILLTLLCKLLISSVSREPFLFLSSWSNIHSWCFMNSFLLTLPSCSLFIGEAWSPSVPLAALALAAKLTVTIKKGTIAMIQPIFVFVL